VFEMFKKPDAEHNNGELNTAEPCENTEDAERRREGAISRESPTAKYGRNIETENQKRNRSQEVQDRETKERNSRTEATMRSPSKSAKHTSPEIGNTCFFTLSNNFIQH